MRDLDRMGQPGAVIIAFVFDKDLGFMFQAAEGAGMDDAIAVTLKRRAKAGHPLDMQAATRLVGLAGERGKHMEPILFGAVLVVCVRFPYIRNYLLMDRGLPWN